MSEKLINFLLIPFKLTESTPVSTERSHFTSKSIINLVKEMLRVMSEMWLKVYLK